MKKCKVCGDKTEVVFNINFKATPVCENCATAIFLQQANWYAEMERKKISTQNIIISSPKSRCCGRCDGINDLCVADKICKEHSTMGCEICYGER